MASTGMLWLLCSVIVLQVLVAQADHVSLLCKDIVKPAKAMGYRSDQISCLDRRERHNCSLRVPDATTGGQCIARCEATQGCIGVGMTGCECFIHKECPQVKCYIRETSHCFFQKCPNGFWNMVFNNCSCPGARTGTKCQNYPRDCHDVANAGYPWGQLDFEIDPLMNNVPMLVRCVIWYPGRSYCTVFHIASDFNANRSYFEYVNGFSEGYSYWAGLKVWHALSTSRNYTTVKQTRQIGLFDERNSYAYNWIVRAENEGYAISYSTTDGLTESFNDCYFQTANNTKFSTWDHDVDSNATVNCASTNGRGWWYNGHCEQQCNPLKLFPNAYISSIFLNLYRRAL